MARSIKSFPNQSGAVTTVVCSLPKLELSVPTDLLLDEERGGAAALKEWIWTHCQDALLEALTVRGGGGGGKQSASALVEHEDDDHTMASSQRSTSPSVCPSRSVVCVAFATAS